MPEIEAAADGIRNGKLVVMPTETVYGLAADATNESAIQKVFVLKGRPSDNPLIVHLGSTATLEQVAKNIPEEAWTLVARFWPGPLTLVLPRAEAIPATVSAGLSTVAVRMPNHPVALALLSESERPLAAPSANLFTHLSPTRAEDVSSEIRAGISAVLDGGPCAVGIESTVLDLTGSTPTILRPGIVTPSQIEFALGCPVALRDLRQDVGARPAPGGYRRHYSPRTPIRLAERLGPTDAGIALTTAPARGRVMTLPADPAGYASFLYSALAELDGAGHPELVIERPPDTPAWIAIHDRLGRM